MSENETPAPRGPGRPPRQPYVASPPLQPDAPRNAERVSEHLSGREQREPERAAEHAPARVRTRQRRSNINDNPFDIPVDEIPEGSSYEWKRWSNVGAEDPYYIAAQRKQGWEPVDPRRHPSWVPPGYAQPYIIREGLILMERPLELTLEAKDEIRQASRQMVVEAEQRLGMAPKDTLTRDHDGVRPKLVKEYMRQVAVED